VGFALTTFFHFGFFPALAASMLVTALLGVIIEKFAYKPIRNSTRIAALITAISVSLFLEYGMMYFVKAETRTFPEVLPNKQINLFNTNAVLDIKNLYIILVTISLMLILQYVIYRTKVGKAMRAVSLDRDAAQLMGINMNSTISYTFAIGSALAGAAGVLVGTYYNSINPLMGVVPGLKAFVAAVIGGIGVIPGAVFGGFFLGMTETLVSAFGGSLYKDAVAFAILILVLLIKPNGLLGRNIKEKV
jgi:branched-chain amino acid transport system permease protein